jgi:hypothetical protein
MPSHTSRTRTRAARCACEGARSARRSTRTPGRTCRTCRARAARSARLLPPPLPSSWEGGKWPGWRLAQTLTFPRRTLGL